MVTERLSVDKLLGRVSYINVREKERDEREKERKEGATLRRPNGGKDSLKWNSEHDEFYLILGVFTEMSGSFCGTNGPGACIPIFFRIACGLLNK